jgi:hypothetical protein
LNRYFLVDELDNEFELSDKSFQLLSNELTIEAELIQKSFRAGAEFPGVQRDQSSTLTFEYDVNLPDDTSYRTYMNTLLMWFRKTYKIKDKLLNLETRAIYTGNNIGYDRGGFLRGSANSVTFAQLLPYWQDVDYTTSTGSGTGGDILVFNVEGYIETPPLITITANSATSKFYLYVSETREGILIEDPFFGLNGLNTYIIDCAEGTAELNQQNRNETIKSGTGFFNFQVGTNTLEFSCNGDCEIEVSYKNRYYL